MGVQLEKRCWFGLGFSCLRASHDLAGPYVCHELVLFPGRYEYIWTIETARLGLFAGPLSKQRAKLKVRQYKGKLSTKHKRKITF